MIQPLLWKLLVVLYFTALALAIIAAALKLTNTIDAITASYMGDVAAITAASIWIIAMLLLLKESYDEQAAR